MGRTGLWALCAALLASLVALPSAASGHRAAASAVAVVNVAYNAELKASILVDGRGHTLYLYTSDVQGTPYCYNDSTYHCSKAWPPLLTTGAPHAGKGVKAALLGTVKRTDGGVQVTYAGHPLYTDAGGKAFSLVPDKKPGDINGQNFVGIWFVVSPKGKAITHT